MKRSSSKTATVISICGLFAALSVVIMLASFLGVTTYAVPAISGALLIILYLEFGVKNAFTVYLAVSVLSFLICEKEAALCYIFFFGYYPILKAFIEKIHNKTIQWIIKIGLFSLSFFIVTVLGVLFLDIPLSEMSMGMGIYGIIGFAVALEIMFVVYDIAMTRVITLYLVKYREKFRRMMKLNKK